MQMTCAMQSILSVVLELKKRNTVVVGRYLHPVGQLSQYKLMGHIRDGRIVRTKSSLVLFMWCTMKVETTVGSEMLTWEKHYSNSLLPFTLLVERIDVQLLRQTAFSMFWKTRKMFHIAIGHP